MHSGAAVTPAVPHSRSAHRDSFRPPETALSGACSPCYKVRVEAPGAAVYHRAGKITGKIREGPHGCLAAHCGLRIAGVRHHCSGLGAGLSGSVGAPDRAVRRGGPADVYARVIAQHLSEQLKQTFVVEDRPGAGSIIGTDAVAKSPPDGYTLLVMSNTP